MQGRNQGVGGCRAAATPKPVKLKLKKADFVDIMISKVLRDLPFSQNEPLKPVDDWYIRISKTKFKRIIKSKKTGHCD
jgi:hypothetical protein